MLTSQLPDSNCTLRNELGLGSQWDWELERPVWNLGICNRVDRRTDGREKVVDCPAERAIEDGHGVGIGIHGDDGRGNRDAHTKHV